MLSTVLRTSLVGLLVLATDAWAQTPPSTQPALGAAGGAAGDTGQWHRLVGILQYLEADYPAALASQDPFELEEQNAFIAEAVDAAKALGSRGSAFVPRLESMKTRINAVQDPEGVSRDAGALIEDLVEAGGLARSPRAVPDLKRGKELFAQTCAACHAADGSGDVPHRHTMTPPPANFLDAETMGELTAYKAFNTTGFGVTGTAMPSFAAVHDESDRWSLAFFALSMRHPPCDGKTPRVSLEKLATATDNQLAAEYGKDAVACLRHNPPQPNEEDSLLAARGNIQSAITLAAAGQKMQARQALLDAYLMGVEPVEALISSRDGAVVKEIEAGVLRMRLAIENGSAEVPEHGAHLITLIDRARRAGANTSAWAVAGFAFLVLLREGFEALIVIAALLAVLKRMQAQRHARVVHAGWVSALIVSIGVFLFAQKALAGANREWMEGIVALVAVVMLVYAAVWLNARANMSAFMKGLRSQMEGALGRGSIAGLFLVSFSAVGRETFETALFLQGLSIDSPSGAMWGAVAGAVVLTGLVVVVSRVGYRLPMKQLFSASTVLLFATAVVLLGKGLRALQEVGVVPVRPLPFIEIDILGIYPDAYTLLPQLLLALSPFAWRAVSRLRAEPASSTAIDADAGAGPAMPGRTTTNP